MQNNHKPTLMAMVMLLHLARAPMLRLHRAAVMQFGPRALLLLLRSHHLLLLRVGWPSRQRVPPIS